MPPARIREPAFRPSCRTDPVVTYLEDGTRFPLAGDRRRPIIDPAAVAIGWLDVQHLMRTGAVPDEFLDALRELCARGVNRTRGTHYCAFCPPPSTPGELQPFIHSSAPSTGNYVVGNAEIHVPGRDNQRYAAPNMIVHYVEAHGYQPPSEFVEATVRAWTDRTWLTEHD